MKYLDEEGLSHLWDKITDKINNIVDIVYPVGSIYISSNSTDPSNLFGGTWEQIKDMMILAVRR